MISVQIALPTLLAIHGRNETTLGNIFLYVALSVHDAARVKADKRRSDLRASPATEGSRAPTQHLCGLLGRDQVHCAFAHPNRGPFALFYVPLPPLLPARKEYGVDHHATVSGLPAHNERSAGKSLYKVGRSQSSANPATSLLTIPAIRQPAWYSDASPFVSVIHRGMLPAPKHCDLFPSRARTV